MADQPTNLFLAPPTYPYDGVFPCQFHGKGDTSGLPSNPCKQCIITELGSAIRFDDKLALRRLIRQGASPNRPCHMDTQSLAIEFPLSFVTSREYYDRSDACFLTLVESGADLKSQAQSEEELRHLKDNLMVFALRPRASPRVLDVVLKLGIADTELGRERLVNAATKRCWYHGVGPDGNEMWTMQDEALQIQRQRIVLSNVPLSEKQKAQFWCGDGYRPEQDY